MVIPILKDRDPEEVASNRSLSLLTITSKVCKKIVLNQFTTYLLNKNRLTTHQSGNKKRPIPLGSEHLPHRLHLGS